MMQTAKHTVLKAPKMLSKQTVTITLAIELLALPNMHNR